MNRLPLLAAALLLALAASAEGVPAELHGTWKIDVPASLHSWSANPALAGDPKALARLPRQIARQALLFTLAIDANGLQVTRGGVTRAASLTLTAAAASRWDFTTVETSASNDPADPAQPASLTLILDPDTHLLQLIAAKTPDMNDYRWRRQPPDSPQKAP